MTDTEPRTNPILVHSPGGAYPIYVADGALDRLGDYCREAGLGGSALVISDRTVGPLYGERALGALRAADYGAAPVRYGRRAGAALRAAHRPGVC
jgi:hypothetical protein